MLTALAHTYALIIGNNQDDDAVKYAELFGAMMPPWTAAERARGPGGQLKALYPRRMSRE